MVLLNINYIKNKEYKMKIIRVFVIGVLCLICTIQARVGFGYKSAGKITVNADYIKRAMKKGDSYTVDTAKIYPKYLQVVLRSSNPQVVQVNKKSGSTDIYKAKYTIKALKVGEVTMQITAVKTVGVTPPSVRIKITVSE